MGQATDSIIGEKGLGKGRRFQAVREMDVFVPFGL